MAYLDTIKSGAIKTWKEHSILPSVVGAQAALESGWGTSKLAKPPHNNQFGIKWSADWPGRKINMPTREYFSGAWVTVNADFRAYDDPGDSLKDHGAFFTNTPWRTENYKDVVGETDYKKACWALQNAPAPYATDNGYAQKLIKIIEQNNLQAWDTEAMSTNVDTVATTSTAQGSVSKSVGSKLTDAGRQYVRDLNVSMIADSLGVGTKPYFENLVPKANYDVLGSRQITHATDSLNGTKVLTNMKNAGTLKEYVVVILGTNRGVTEQEVNNFVSIAGSERKILFVDTASEVAHINTMSVYYQDAAKRLSNVYFVNWRLEATPLKPEYYSKDGANGEYIHMTAKGYQKHAEFIAQAVYEVATGNFTERTASTPRAEYYDIKSLELEVNGLVTYDAWKVNADKTSTKYKATKQTDIKGLHSPYGDNAIYNSAANETWGSGSNVNQSDWIETVYQNGEETSMLELVEQAGRVLLERSEPSRVYTISLVDIPTELTIGDTGIFIDHEYNPPLYIEARVLSMTTSRTNPNLSKVTVGNVKELRVQDKSGVYALMAQLGEVRRDLVEERFQSEPVDVTVSTTNGFVLGDKVGETNLVARVMKGTSDVTEDYDVFEWERVSGNTQNDASYNQVIKASTQSSVLSIMSKDVIGNQSKFVARAYNATGELIGHQEIVIKRVETALWVDTETPPVDGIDGATWVDDSGKQWIKKDGEWEERVDQAQLASVRGEVEGAITEAEAAKQAAQKAYQDAITEAERLVTESETVWQGKMNDYDEKVVLIDASVTSAQTKADQALREVGISTDLAQTAKDLADTAKTNASTALSNSSTAISNASQAVSDALTAKGNAQTALTEAGIAKVTSNGLIIRVDDIKGELELKASQSIVDGISGTVLTQGTLISQNATAITNKAESTLVNTIKGTVDTHTTTLSQHATQISARLTTTQVNSLVDGKGLAKVTYVDNQITATSESFGVELTKVEGKIDGLQVGGRNLLGETSNLEITSTTERQYFITKPLELGVYMVSFHAKANTSNSAQVYINDNSGANRYDGTRLSITLTTEMRKYVIPIEVTKFEGSAINEISLRIRSVGIVITDKEMKLEKGNVATDWSPAPEDTLMQNDFTVFKNTYEATVKSINTELSKTAKTTDLNGMVTESVLSTKNFVTAGTMTTTLSNYIQTGNAPTTTQFNTLKNSYDSMVQTIGTNGSKIAQMVMTDSLFKTTIANASANGVNQFSSETQITPLVNTLPVTRSNMEPNGFKVTGMLGNGGSVRMHNVINSNGWWTISGYLRSSQSVTLTVLFDFCDNTPYSPPIQALSDNKWVYFEYSYDVQNYSAEKNNFIDINQVAHLYYHFKDVKVEKGKGATPWSPSVTSVESQVTQLANSWVMNLKNGTDIVTQISATPDGVRIKGNSIYLDGNTLIDSAVIKSGHIDSLNANKITGNAADFNIVRAGVLSGKVITGDILDVTDGFIGYLFAKDSYIDVLTSKFAFINKIKAIEISADKITAGTISTQRLGRNYARNTSYIETPPNRNNNHLFTQPLDLGVYTLTFYAKANAATTATVYLNDDEGLGRLSGTCSPASISIGTGWQKYTVQVNVSKFDRNIYNKLFIRVYGAATTSLISTKEFMFTKGYVAMDYIPAPEDNPTAKDLSTYGSVTIHGGNITASTIDVGKITGDYATFMETLWESTNSKVKVDGGAIRINNSAGDFATMNSIPEFRSQDANGTASIMGKGRSHYYSGSQSRFYIGSNLEGLSQYGVHIAKGQTWGVYRNSDSYGGTPAQYYNTPVGWGAVQVIEELMRLGLVSNVFATASAHIRSLNGLGGSWPVLQPGDPVLYKLAVAGNSSGVETIMSMGTATNGSTRIYSHVHHVFAGGTSESSDRRLKHDIVPTQVEALDHITSLSFKEFKWNQDNRYEPLGIIAQDSGIIRVSDAEMEGINTTRAVMLGLKGIQELNELVKAQAEEIKLLKEIINQ